MTSGPGTIGTRRNIRAKVDKSFSFLPVCTTNLYIWCWGVAALMELFKDRMKAMVVQSPLYGLCPWEVNGVRRGPKEIKSPITKNHLTRWVSR